MAGALELDETPRRERLPGLMSLQSRRSRLLRMPAGGAPLEPLCLSAVLTSALRHDLANIPESQFLALNLRYEILGGGVILSTGAMEHSSGVRRRDKPILDGILFRQSLSGRWISVSLIFSCVSTLCYGRSTLLIHWSIKGEHVDFLVVDMAQY